jgi:hypothetical protein
MIGPQTDRRRISRVACAVTVAALSIGALASAATAASVKLTMPSQIKKGKDYVVQIDGSYKPGELKGKAYLISVIQFSGVPCKATAQAENRWFVQTGKLVQWYLAPLKQKHLTRVGIFETKSPFTRIDGFTAGDLGTRHVCTWLYPKFIQAGDTTAPIARADKKYRVTR